MMVNLFQVKLFLLGAAFSPEDMLHFTDGYQVVAVQNSDVLPYDQHADKMPSHRQEQFGSQTLAGMSHFDKLYIQIGL